MGWASPVAPSLTCFVGDFMKVRAIANDNEYDVEESGTVRISGCEYHIDNLLATGVYKIVENKKKSKGKVD
jgi:hypothetical protein